MKFFFVALLVLAAFALPDDNCGSDCFYSIAGGKLTVTTHHDQYGDVDDFCHVLPPWYAQRDSITEIEVSAGQSSRGILTIGGCAFRGLHKVTKVTFDAKNELTSIGKRAFEGCSSLTTIELPATISTLGERFFKDCTSLTTIELPDKIGTIGEGAFEGCTKLQTVTLNKVRTIGKNAFNGCTSLAAIEIPSTTTSVDDESFNACPSLASITVADGNSEYLDDNGVLYHKDMWSSKLVRYPPAKEGEGYVMLEKPGGQEAVAVGSGAFEGCLKLKSVTINTKLYADNFKTTVFKGCSALKEFKLAEGATKLAIEDGVVFDSNKKTLKGYPPAKEGSAYEVPNSVTSIESHAFEDCSALETITIPASVETIKTNAFDGCVGLTKFTVAPENTHFVVANDGALLAFNSISKTADIIKFPATSAATEYTFAHPDDLSIEKITANAFEGCTNLTVIKIPTNISTIGERAFKGCTGLAEMNIPKEVESLAKNAFEGCTGLTAINIEQPAEGVRYHKSVDGVFFYKDDGVDVYTLVKYPAKKAGASYSIPNFEATGFKIETIASNAFEGCNLLTSVSIHKNVTKVEAEAFKDCSELASFNTYEGLKCTYGVIDSFENCPKLQKVCVVEGYEAERDYYPLSFGGKWARDCSKPEPTPGPTPGPEPTPEPTGQSSSAAAVIPSLAAVVAVFAMFF